MLKKFRVEMSDRRSGEIIEREFVAESPGALLKVVQEAGWLGRYELVGSKDLGPAGNEPIETPMAPPGPSERELLERIQADIEKIAASSVVNQGSLKFTILACVVAALVIWTIAMAIVNAR